MKKLFCIAALSGFAYHACADNTQPGTMTIYGIVDAGVVYDNSKSAGSTISLKSGNESSSRLGFKGMENLGGNLRALYVLEAGVLLNTGEPDQAGRLFGRQAFVGLSGSAGTLTMGRQYSPIYSAYGIIDPFANNSAGDINTLFGADSNFLGSHKRMDNAVLYATPAQKNGFNATAAYGFGGQAGDTSALSQAGLSVGYFNGDTKILYAYHEANHDTTTSAGETYQSHFLGMTCDFNTVKAHIAADRTTQGSDFTTQSYLIGATIPLGRHALFGDFIYRENKLLADANSGQYALGYNYTLSKRTNLYTIGSYLKNDENSKTKTNEYGKTVTTIQIGIRSVF